MTSAPLNQFYRTYNLTDFETYSLRDSERTSGAASAPSRGVTTYTQYHLIDLMGVDYLMLSLPFYIAAFALETYIAVYAHDKELRHKPTFAGSLVNLGQGVLMFLCAKIAIFTYRTPMYSWTYNNFRVTDAWVGLDSPNQQWRAIVGPDSTVVLECKSWAYCLGSWWLCFLLIDFFYYCWHRAAHWYSWLWAAHFMHHSTEEYNLSVTLREPVPLTEFLIPLEYTIMVLGVAVFGFPMTFTSAIAMNDTLYMNSLHTELVDPLPWCETVFMSASLHRVHHARNLRALGKNYGSVFSIWDRLFGTYEPERLFGQTQYIGETASPTGITRTGNPTEEPLLHGAEATEKADVRDLVPTKPIFYGRWLTEHKADDHEPLRYGVIPQFHNWDMAWANVHHWHYIFFVQSKWDGLLAPFRHWTPPNSKCPPMSATSKINSVMQPQGNALHSGWTLYLLIQFTLFATVSFYYLSSCEKFSQNLLQSFYATDQLACEHAISVDDCQEALGPLASLFGAEKLVSSLLQIGVFAFGMWTMSNFGAILMGTERVREKLHASLMAHDELQKEQVKEQPLKEELDYQNRLVRFEAVRHGAVVCIAIWIGDILITGPKPTALSSGMIRFCITYFCLQMALLMSVCLASHTRIGVQSMLQRRLVKYGTKAQDHSASDHSASASFLGS